MSFTGEYSNNLDQKNRISIPAKYRKALHSSNNKIFVITRGFDKYLTLYPLQEWKIVEEQLSSLGSIKSKHRNFIRNIVRFANYVKYDRQGRIQIPDNLLEYSEISKNATVIGMISKIELWSPNILDKYDKISHDISNGDFEDLANKINF